MSQALVSNTDWALFFFVCDTVYETVSHTSFVKTVKSLIGYALIKVKSNEIHFQWAR